MEMNVLYFHSILRYFVLLFLILVTIRSLSGKLLKRDFSKTDKAGALVLMIVCDLQLLFGLAIYFMNNWLQKMQIAGAMKVKPVRFFGLEHPLIMLIAIVLIHVGYSATKKNIPDMRKFSILFWCSVISLFLVLARIPWQGMKDVGRPFVPKIENKL